MYILKGQFGISIKNILIVVYFEMLKNELFAKNSCTFH